MPQLFFKRQNKIKCKTYESMTLVGIYIKSVKSRKNFRKRREYSIKHDEEKKSTFNNIWPWRNRLS